MRKFVGCCAYGNVVWFSTCSHSHFMLEFVFTHLQRGHLHRIEIPKEADNIETALDQC